MPAARAPEDAPDRGDGQARRGCLRQGRDPLDHPRARRKRRRGLCVRIRGPRDRRVLDRGAPDRLQHVDRRRRALRLRESRRHHGRVPARAGVRAEGRGVRARGALVEVDGVRFRRALCRPRRARRRAARSFGDLGHQPGPERGRRRGAAAPVRSPRRRARVRGRGVRLHDAAPGRAARRHRRGRVLHRLVHERPDQRPARGRARRAHGQGPAGRARARGAGLAGGRSDRPRRRVCPRSSAARASIGASRAARCVSR